MIIKKEITTTKEIKIETMKLENLLEMIVQQEQKKEQELSYSKLKRRNISLFLSKLIL